MSLWIHKGHNDSGLFYHRLLGSLVGRLSVWLIRVSILAASKKYKTTNCSIALGLTGGGILSPP